MRRPAAVVPRLVASLMLAVATLITGAASSMAGAPDTLWVDGDGTVGASDCSGGQEALTTIQVAIELAGRGDTIKVCPGTYAETLWIEGRRKKRISLVSVSRHEAVLVEPTTQNGSSLITVRAEHVTVDGFRLRLMPESSWCRFNRGVDTTTQGAVTLKNLLIQADMTAIPSADRCQLSGIFAHGNGRVTITDSTITGATQPLIAVGTPHHHR